ncbi:glycosyltransferase [Arhodomonas sp. AD133]|uniref:glycosyltransferase n=1 Tax=Arhodomonas sp. AD133 TaxID=3415009 RepID=UPI003EBCB98E
MLYDALYVRGGAEQVTLQLARDFRAELYCAFRDVAAFPDEMLTGTGLTELGTAVHHPVWRTISGLRAFRRHPARGGEYDWIVYSGTTAPVAVRHHPNALNVYYCHTIPRFIYDLRAYYMQSLSPWQRPFLAALIRYVQPQFEAAMARMDTLVANSENVRARIRRYLARDAEVVYPPCDVDSYQWREEGDYYLSTARLEPYKRVDLVVEAFRRMPDKRLVVASGGSDEVRVRRLAADAPNITFVGWCDGERLRALVGGARATVYIPRDEDFGMSPVESMAAGKPVIGVAEGGLLETVVHEETGLLIPAEPSIDDVVCAVQQLSPSDVRGMRQACEARAALFSADHFRDLMRKIVRGQR